ncbi:MAG: hypothetical protein F3745_07715 [Nitrospinae bacterium]|nr:hypothetical protein [Nitrospinota bacterium]
MDSSPFFKLKANTEIRTSGYRGDDFTNLWVTDDLGYKNNFKNISQKRFDFLALGDSFTEAMGVATENAWPSLLSKNHNIKVYNAGVQGYASSQMYGTLMLLKDKINFEGIIIGALPSIYLREKHFLTSVKPRSGVGGIESIRLGTTGAGLGSTGRRLNGITDTFFVDLLRKALRKVRKISFKDLLSFSNESSAFPTIEGPLARYRSELLNSMPDSIEEVNHNRYWREQLSNYKKIISWAKANDKVVYLVQFPHRHEIYFSPSFQGLQSILDTQYYVELELLKRELDEYVRIIDLFPVIKSAFEKEPNRMMYFKIDGHMNEYGQELISNSLAKSLKSKTH